MTAFSNFAFIWNVLANISFLVFAVTVATLLAVYGSYFVARNHIWAETWPGKKRALAWASYWGAAVIIVLVALSVAWHTGADNYADEIKRVLWDCDHDKCKQERRHLERLGETYDSHKLKPYTDQVY